MESKKSLDPKSWVTRLPRNPKDSGLLPQTSSTKACEIWQMKHSPGAGEILGRNKLSE